MVSTHKVNVPSPCHISSSGSGMRQLGRRGSMGQCHNGGGCRYITNTALYGSLSLLSDHFIYSVCTHAHIFTFLLGKYLGEELLGHTVSIYLTLLKTAKLFSKVVCHLTFLF